MKGLLTEILGIAVSEMGASLGWSLLDISLEDRNDSLGELSCAKCVLEEELDCADERFTEFPEDCRRTPTAPISRLIAPILEAGRESGEGT